MTRDTVLHRYDIQVILCIKELKKKGFSLKEIKKVIPLFYETVKQEETNSKGDDLEREVLEKENSQRISEIKNLEKSREKVRDSCKFCKSFCIFWKT